MDEHLELPSQDANLRETERGRSYGTLHNTRVDMAVPTPGKELKQRATTYGASQRTSGSK